MRLIKRRCRMVAVELRETAMPTRRMRLTSLVLLAILGVIAPTASHSHPSRPNTMSASPALPNEGGAAAMMAALADAVAKGQITAGEAAEMAKLVERFIDANEAAAFRNQLRTLEDGALARKR